ncbi:MAG TPA: heavy metal translocating P-type ATPase [Candidatus Polarisedimenticolia bacterium]|nr:heavy metal translocating P-type ATPase [Candidatus Polarisedimenticolia bacterium]
MATKSQIMNRVVLGLVVAGISAGLVLQIMGNRDAAGVVWAATTMAALVPLTLSVVRDLLSWKAGVDVIALLAMGGSLALGEYLAGAVIALMLSGGQALEQFAAARARRELKALMDRSPRKVHRFEEAGLAERSIEEVLPGDLLLVRAGEIVPVDGRVEGSAAILDESALTGEALPVERPPGDAVRSGTLNAAGSPFELRAAATAQKSTYAAIVRLVEQAQSSKAPLIRMADRYALFFLPASLALAALAWSISGEPVRALAVLVVATPCPLILAAPVAFVSGISRAARRGIIVKGAGALEALARGEILILDKTGTVTGGAPVLTDVISFGEESQAEILRLAASLEQASMHMLAEPILREARERKLSLSPPMEALEQLGEGIRGLVDRREVALGKSGWILQGLPAPAALRRVRRRAMLEGASSVLVSVDGKPAGALILEDLIRPDAPRTLRNLRRIGFRKIWLLTGDHLEVSELVGAALGVDRVLADRTPAEKTEGVLSAKSEGITVMVGDGINDAPALAAAHVGVAMGARGATASSEAADIVLMTDRLDRLEEGVGIARRSGHLALQSILAGMGLSLLAMGFAAAGRIPPVVGALLQEAIDAAVILNALRALSGRLSLRGDKRGSEVAARFRAEHRTLLPEVRRIREVADRLDSMNPAAIRSELVRVHDFLSNELLPHEIAEDATAYPVVARIIGGTDPTATMSRAHLEIGHRIRMLGSLLADIPAEGPTGEEVGDFRRILYGLDAILRLHFAQEEETYLPLLDGKAAPLLQVHSSGRPRPDPGGESGSPAPADF